MSAGENRYLVIEGVIGAGKTSLARMLSDRLTAELARLRGTDPDSLHGRREPWQAAMTALRL